MSLAEKKAWSFLAIAVLGYGIYLFLVLDAAASGSAADVDYAAPMVWTIGSAIVVGILANIAIASSTPAHARQVDQRDQEIARIGEHVGQAFIVLGGVGALVLALLRADHFWIANVIYLGFVLSAMVGSVARLIAYRRGVPAW